METQNSRDQPPSFSNSLGQAYQEALLRSGIQAAKLLSELMALGIMPDPRAKDMADVALEVMRLINSTSLMSQSAEDYGEEPKPAEVASPAAQDASELVDASSEVASSAPPDGTAPVDEQA